MSAPETPSNVSALGAHDVGQRADASAAQKNPDLAKDPAQAGKEKDAAQAATTKGVEKLKRAMTALYGFATGAADTAKADSTTPSTTADQPASAGGSQTTADTTGTQPKSGAEVAGTGTQAAAAEAAAAANDQSNILTAIQAAFPDGNINAGEIQTMVKSLTRAGYKIVKA